jgi:hypothetical protein
MAKQSAPTLGDLYGEMLKGISTVNESVKKGGNDLSDKVPAPLQSGGPQEKGGFHKSLEDALDSMYSNDEDEEMEDEEEECEDGCECEKHDNDEDEEEIVVESKKISKQRLNTNMKHKSSFDRLFAKINENFDNFGHEDAEDLDALGLGDAESDDEMGDDFSDEEDDTVTVTLDRATAQALVDVLQGVLGEDEGDDAGEIEDDSLDFSDESDDMDFDEDEETETIGAKDGKGGGTQHKLQNKNNKVSGKPQPGSQSASHAVTDKVGNDGDHGHALHGAKQPNIGKNNKVSNVKQGQDFFR